MGEASKLGVQLGDLWFPYFLKFSRSQIWIYLDLSHRIAYPFVDLVVIFVWGEELAQAPAHHGRLTCSMRMKMDYWVWVAIGIFRGSDLSLCFCFELFSLRSRINPEQKSSVSTETQQRIFRHLALIFVMLCYHFHHIITKPDMVIGQCAYDESLIQEDSCLCLLGKLGVDLIQKSNNTERIY